ncbi:initiator tRNA phosphoribosyl transferase [Gloeophyllum trabeum ATCC 11539]|uniref:Initiator tRNA phosphoribosyl transferase n=1 Tax=Gloeophyllum trabeum (strain ATCC 11539 / FP-39264 / Madison 617) TaxID=670483 RepID=S7Q769_GLOTA|nr:initiator tRNA phosphoribosyl transferase [Gloeophyllum trabeum ATCC 11539]EPQ55288.1 initiator tRNA phosphoribosyl transferase [Gloeophyllum trabeum ATCC 11539]
MALALLRKESLDIYNRLHSVAEDITFVNEVHRTYPLLPILPNLRCGAWYTDPSIVSDIAAYFKSTDGHFGNWSFNLRRPNLHLLPLAVEHNGMILVDSTRAGKRMPDALSKTVPIWCAVLNRAVRLRQGLLDPDSWDTRLYTPPGTVSAQEAQQIEEHLDAWARSLADSSYALPHLPHPLRPLWLTPSTSVFPRLPEGFILVLCVSASKRVDAGIERRQAGFAYVQGSGDDHELWGKGLTPSIFWAHKDRLLNCTRAELPALVDELVTQDRIHRAREVRNDWTAPPVPIRQVSGALLICRTSDLPTTLPDASPPAEGDSATMAYVIITNDIAEASDSEPNVLRLRTPPGKKGQLHFLEIVLPQSVSFIGSALRAGRKVCIACDEGTDTSVGVALVALQRFFNDEGRLVPDGKSTADKQTIRTRLQWIISSQARANPSRTTLKRVNEFLLTSPSFRSFPTNSLPSP